jgi:hypothetical protein
VIPTLYSFGKAKIVGIASAFGVDMLNKRRSDVNTAGVTGVWS